MQAKTLGNSPIFPAKKSVETAANVALIITNDFQFLFYANLEGISIFELSALYLHKFWAMEMFEIIAAIWLGVFLTHAPEQKPRSRSINTVGAV